MSLSFISVGVGDAFSTRHYSSSLLLESQGRRLLVDCAHPIRKALYEATGPEGFVDLGDLDAVLLTHLHADHASGLEGYGFFAYFVLQRRAQILAHPLVSEHLWHGHLAAGMSTLFGDDGATPVSMDLDDYFQITALSTEEPVCFGPFQILCRFTHHPVPTTAVRISAGGRTLGYSSDTSFDPELIRWLEPAELVVHETNLGIHTDYQRLCELPEALRARMRLIHYPDDLDPRSSAIEPLVQGRRYLV